MYQLQNWTKIHASALHRRGALYVGLPWLHVKQSSRYIYVCYLYARSCNQSMRLVGGTVVPVAMVAMSSPHYMDVLVCGEYSYL